MNDQAQQPTGLQAPVAMPETRVDYKMIAMNDTGAGGGILMPRSFGEVVAFAELMARAQHAIPKHLRNNPGACMAITMQALRWEMDPFAVASKAYNVNDQIAYEAQLVAAVVNTRAPIKRRPDYEFEGQGADLRCRVSVEMLDGSVKVYESPKFGQIPTKNSPLWKSDPQQQLGYYSIRSWARRYCPEVLLGIYTPEEMAERVPVGPDRAKDITPLAERLAARERPADGFNPAFVEAETGAAPAARDELHEDENDAPANASPAGAREAAAVVASHSAAADLSEDDGAAGDLPEDDGDLPPRTQQRRSREQSSAMSRRIAAGEFD